MALGLGADTARAADSCPNAALRVGPAAALPDCRAYELVSPDLNHASLLLPPNGRTTAEGNKIVYQTADAPEHASSGQALYNYVRASRDGEKGWSGVSLSPPLHDPITANASFITMGVSADLSSTLEYGDQPLDGGPAPDGANLYLGRPVGTYRLLTTAGGTFFHGLNSYAGIGVSGGTPDFSHVYFQPARRQLPTDPTQAYNTYAWSEDKGLRLIGILPNGTAAPNGAGFGGVSDDGRYVAFLADGRLYLRIDDARTVEVGASQRTTNPDPNPASQPASVSVTADGSKVLFTSASALTNDANTGESGGVPTDAGRDLYSYDVATGKLTDLTVDTDPADAATGANLLGYGNGGPPIVAVTSNGSHVYFTATGNLADGHVAGHRSLYVWHDGRIEYIADADALDVDLQSGAVRFAISPDGRHVAFASTEMMTGYENVDPTTGQPHYEVFKLTLDSELVCASCRANGTSPTGDSTIPTGLRRIRTISDDGGRLFFHSTDAVVPQASGGFQQVFEYADGKASAISGVAGRASAFLDASASGDDVFFQTYETLVPNPRGGDSAVYDARVNGGIPIPASEECSGVACQPSGTPAPVLAAAASIAFLGDGNVQDSSVSAVAPSKVTVSKVKTIVGSVGSLRIKVPGKGRVTVSGSGLQTKRSSSTKPQTVTMRLALTAKAAKTLRKRRSLKAKVRVTFSDTDGHASGVTLAITFKAGSARKGR